MRIGSDRRLLFRLLALLIAFTLVAAACGDDDDDGEGAGGTDTTEAEGQRGGSAVFAAEQWPECINPVISCANSSWMHTVSALHVFPKVMELSPTNEFEPGPVLESYPEITEDPFTVTYKIHPDATWSDGNPITSEDFEFSRRVWLETPGSLTTQGYELVESIDTSDPKTAVVTFTEPYADWWDMWGGNSEYLFNSAAMGGDPAGFENEMLDSYPYSGGPWVLESWSPEQTVFVRNEKYWDDERTPLLDQVTFVPRTDANTMVNSLLSGETLAMYPQAFPGIFDQLDDPNITAEVGLAVTFEGLWFNHSAPPLDSKAVREAIGYAVDRQAIIDTVISQLAPGLEVLNCAGWVPHVGDWCDNTDFADLTYDPATAKEVLEADGWTLGSDGIFEKGGQKLEVKWATVAGNKRREDTQQLVIEQAREAGILFTTDNSDAAELFQNRLPRLQFVMGEYAQLASPDPSLTEIYACAQIPREENDFGGQNYTAWCNEEADALLRQADAEVDPEARLDLIHQIGDIVREDVVWLPLYVLPQVIAYDNTKLGGPVELFKDNSNTAYVNMYDWFLK